MRSKSLPIAAVTLSIVASGAAIGCAPHTDGASATKTIPHAVSARLEWERVSTVDATDARGRPVDAVEIRGGEVVRITTDASDPIEVGERVQNGTGVAESWTKHAPERGVVVVRATLLGTTILLPKGVATRVHIGRAEDPGFAWYDLEEHVLSWAKGPLPAPFPPIAPAERIDREGFAALDAALAKAVGKSADQARAREAATAIRRVAGLRAVRALRPPAGFPYFYDDPLTPDDDDGRRKKRALGNLQGHYVSPVEPMAVTVEGPRILQVWSFGVRRDQDEEITIRVVEGDHERARSAGALARARAARPAGEEQDSLPEVPVEEAETVALRRAVVHVPPGRHSYRIEAKNGAAFVAASASKPVVHVGDAISGVKDEKRQLELALAKCDRGSALCTIATALAGLEGSKEAWTAVLEALEPETRKIVEILAAGGPRDPMVALENAAAHGDPQALAALGKAALGIVDEGVRGAWLRGTTRGTKWVVASPLEAREGERWLSLLFDEAPKDEPRSVFARADCARAADAPWTEVGADSRSFTTTTWRGARTLELLAATTCQGEAPIALEIDGQPLPVNPAAALAKWHVLVRGETARVRRADAGTGHVYAIKPEAAACGARWAHIGAPTPASKGPALRWDPSATAPGLEVWLRDGAKAAELAVVADGDPKKRATVAVGPREGLVAIDGDGRRWTRVARVGLPVWAATGAHAVGGDDVAVRAVVRAPKGGELAKAAEASDLVGVGGGPQAEAEPLDESKLVAHSRSILATQGGARGAKYLDRALYLASGGASRAALEDARAAKGLGAKGPRGEDPIELVRASIRPLPRRPLELPKGVVAYGIEPDFDPGAPRCAATGKGPRAKIASVLEDLKLANAAQKKVWDAQLAIRALEAVTESAIDPRGPSVLSRALAGSRWELPKLTAPELVRVQRPNAQTDEPGQPGLSRSKEGPLDPDGDLRPRIGTGQPFDRASYATVTEARPAKAGLTGTGNARARVEFACVARAPADVVKGARCPIAITLGGTTAGGSTAPATVLRPNAGEDGRGVAELPPLPPKGAATQLVVALEPAPGRWAAIARIVFDQEVPGATQVEGVGWVLQPPGLQWRWLVKDTQEITTTFEGPGLLRVDALAEPEERPTVVVVVDGKQHKVALDGTPTMIAVPKGGPVRIRSTGGTSTIAVAHRVARTALPDLLALEEIEPEPAQAEASERTEATAVTTTALLDAGNPNALWRDAVASSPRPLTPVEEALGTITLQTQGRYGTFREGDPRKEFSDGYLEQTVGYRRKIESLGIWTGVSALGRAREGRESWGASAFAWTMINPLRLRLAVYGDVFGQTIEDQAQRTFRPRAYAEMSFRVAPSFFVLPRVGYDGFYTTVDSRPVSLTGVDDDVYNGFRFRRPTILYQQVMAWWVPYVNQILFLRGRLNEDVRAGVSHGGVRPGAIFAFGNLELGGFGDATWFRATEGLRSQSKVDVTGVAYALYNLWISEGSVDVQPGIGGRARAGDGAWEVYALFNVFASFRRGVRDFSSPELAFPEQFGGNVPWRGPAVGGTR
jgi:hypothetical protein